MPTIDLNVNGVAHRVTTDAARSLLSVLRDDLELTGCKYGCGAGSCGACTVISEGRAIKSCTTAVGDVAGKKIRTVEGLEENGRLHPLQQAFLDVGAMQCGYCTCGMIMAGVALLTRNPQPSREDIVQTLDGNLCRCGTYGRIIDAVQKAAATMKGGSR